jgi:PilZ domain
LVKKRIGDRRRRPRFEIVGTLTGTLETWQRFRLVNLAAGGALIESLTPLVPGSRVNGRVMICGQMRDVRAVVRRVEAESQRYNVAVEWGQALAETDTLLTSDAVPQRRDGAPNMVERRRTPRVAPSNRPEIQWPTWSTVELIDISTSGVFFTSPVPLGPGDKAQLRLRLGERSFTAEMEVRRAPSEATRRAGFPLAAVFTAVDDASRFTLDDFLGDQGG